MFDKVIKGPNVVLLGILAGLVYKFPAGVYLYFSYLLFICVLIIRKFIVYGIPKFNNFFIAFNIISLGYLISCIMIPEDREYFIRFYLIVYTTVFYLYFSFQKHGVNYAENFYKQLLVVLNIFSVLNLYEIIYHRPLLEQFMRFTENSYNYHIGEQSYRTLSFFNHPIIAGLFFVILFFMNLYMIKNPSVYFFQALTLLNIYSTMSRSAWLAFATGIFFYSILRFRGIKKIKIPERFTYRQVFFIYFSIIPIVAGIVFLYFNWVEIYNAIIDRFGNSLSLNSTDGSNLQRTMTINLIFNQMYEGSIFNFSFGYGFNTVREFMLSNPLLIKGFGSTDNTYLSWFYEYGVVGILVYIGIGVSIFKRIIANKLNWATELSLIIALVISVSIFFFEFTGWVAVSVLFAFVLCNLLFSLDIKKTKRKSKTKEILKREVA